VDYAHPRGVFVPPLCTLRPGYQFGLWFSELLPHIQHEVETIYTGLLATGLGNRITSTLAKHRILAGLIGNTSNGYEALYLMAQFAGHPLLNTSTSTQREPRQANDQTVQEYVSDWIYYLYHQSLSGIFLSDRYFVQQFVTGLHFEIQFCLGDSFENAANQHPRTEALPSGFHPLQISMTLRDRASRIQCLRLLELPPREILKSSGSFVRQIVSDVSPAEDVELLAAVTSTPSPWQCLMCRASNHLFNECPKISDLDQNTRRVVFSSLLRARGPSRSQPRPSTGSRPSQAQRVHAITADDTSMPFDETALDFASATDDSTLIEEAEAHLDFQ